MPGIDQLTGQMLGVYRVERVLGQSQLGAAYLAVEPGRGTRVMITTFTFPHGQEAREREQCRARFAREGARLTRLVHPAIIPIYACGEQDDFLYLVTAFVKEPSLGQILRQNERLTPPQTLHVLRQLAAGLDYAHSQGVAHGMLSLANLVMNASHETGIAGFGLHTMLEMHGSSQSARPLAHLSSAQGAFLGSPEYIAPERVLGLACDWRVDIYALGVIVFALLSGIQPFHAATPLDTALQRLQQPTPLLHAICPDVPEAFDLVIGRALERDPARRFQNAGEFVSAFERVLKAQEAAQSVNMAASGPREPEAQMTMPPTVNWFDEQITPSGRWQVAPSIGPARMRTLEQSPYSTDRLEAPEQAQLAPSPYSTDRLEAPGKSPLAPSPYSTDRLEAPGKSPLAPSPYNTEGLSAPQTPPRGAIPKAPGASLAGIDPFAWWSSRAIGRKPLPAAQPAAARPAPLRLALPGFQTHAHRRPDQQGRRKVVALAVAGVATAGALTIGAVTFAHLTQSIKQPARSSASSAPTVTARATTTPAATKAPAHTGTVIGATTLAANSARIFTNPADGVSSLLIRLANGNFVACERTCTHQGVSVNYDPRSKMIVCPAHGAVFDPKNGFSHVSGPGQGPLTRVAIHVNNDGTITTG
ncbi:MAG TPA: protein kinase [Ktedonobacteraceae bacterium]|nr:protein kinase [Ktedonobacteraceae bacterium]